MFKKYFYLIIIILISLAKALNSFSQNKELKFKNISVEDGLSQSIVYSILRDHDGFMWFGTFYGLNKYDGHEFIIYRNIPHDTTSLSGNDIRFIHEDSKKRLWIGTFGYGLNLFDREKEIFYHFFHDPGNSNSLSSNEINTIFEDNEGFLWIGTTDGLNRMDMETGRIERIFHNEKDDNTLCNNNIQVILQDREGNIWIGTWKGLSVYNPERGTFTTYNATGDDFSLSDNTVLSLYEDYKGSIWVGTRFGGLNKFQKKIDGFETISPIKSGKSGISPNTILALSGDSAGNLFIGTWKGGLNIYNENNNTLTVYNHDGSDEQSLASDQLWNFYDDGLGILWIGTHGGGISKLEYNRNFFEYYLHDVEVPGSMSDNNVQSIFRDSRGVLWIGTYIGGLKMYLENADRFETIVHNKNNPQYSVASNRIGSITEDGKGNLWIGNHLTENTGGLTMYNPSTKKFTHFYHDPKNSNSLSNNDVRALFFDNAGNLWIGTDAGGLNKYILSERRFVRYYHNPDDKTTLSSDRITSINQDKEGYIWVGTRDGLNKLNPITGATERFYFEKNNINSLSNNYISELYFSENNILWIGTEYGLNRFDLYKGEFEHYYQIDGLPENAIRSIEEDKQGNLWISTANGLCRFNPSMNVFTCFYSEDGLQSNEFTQASFKDKNGKLYFGGINGFNAFNPDSIKNNPFVPEVKITGFRLFNKSIECCNDNSVLKKPITETEEILLSHKQNFISFEFVALNYLSPEKNQYEYLLEGYEDVWNEIDNNRIANYTKLEPGEYIFKVKASNNDNLWNEEGSSIAVTIIPPFYKTTWFRIIVILSFFALALLLHRLRVNSIKSRKKVLEKLVTKRTHEVEKQKTELQHNNVMLTEQAQELMNMNTQLDAQKQEIRLQSEQIKKMNEFLKQKNLKLTHDIHDISEARILQKQVSFKEFREIYPDDESCLKFLDELKWNPGYKCVKCGSKEYRYTQLKDNNIPYSRRCKKCKSIESPTVGTIFYRIKFPLVKAFYITFLVMSGKYYTVDELSQKLDLRRQTCWAFKKKIQNVLKHGKYLNRNKDSWSNILLDADRVYDNPTINLNYF